MNDEASLPNGLYVLRMYTELKNGSHNISLVVRNRTSQPISRNGRRIIWRVVTTKIVPKAEPSPKLLHKLNKDEEPVKKLISKER